MAASSLKLPPLGFATNIAITSTDLMINYGQWNVSTTERACNLVLAGEYIERCWPPSTVPAHETMISAVHCILCIALPDSEDFRNEDRFLLTRS